MGCEIKAESLQVLQIFQYNIIIYKSAVLLFLKQVKLKTRSETHIIMKQEQNGPSKYFFCNRSGYFLLSWLCLKASSFLLHLSLFINVSVWKYPPTVMRLTDSACLRVIDLRCGVSHKHMSEEDSEWLNAAPSLSSFTYPTPAAHSSSSHLLWRHCTLYIHTQSSALHTSHTKDRCYTVVLIPELTIMQNYDW